jgi:hypothetical protein
MSRKPTSKRTRPKPKAVLRLPDLDQAKSAVLNSLTSGDAQRGYRHAIDEFVDWYAAYAACGIGAGLVHGFATPREANWSRFSFCSVTFRFKQPNDTSVANSGFKVPSTTKLG